MKLSSLEDSFADEFETATRVYEDVVWCFVDV